MHESFNITIELDKTVQYLYNATIDYYKHNNPIDVDHIIQYVEDLYIIPYY